jgi:phospholipid/cholesterol/gamma-HCH transport system substrate-binding protein
MSRHVRNFLVGMVAIIALIGFASLLMLFGELEDLTQRRYSITVEMNTAAGLRERSIVELNGVPIGRIESISLESAAELPVQVVLRIDDHVRIPTTTVGRVDIQLIGGAAIMQLDSSPPLPGSDATFHPTDGTASMTIVHQPLMEQVIAELDTRAEPLMRALEDFERLSATYITVGENLNALIAPQSPQAIAAGEAPNLHAAITRFHEVIDDTQTALRLAQNWLGDEELRTEAREAVINARQLIEDASETLSHVGEMADRLEGRADELASRLLPIADELGVIFEQVRHMTQLISDGDGTVAQLLNNPDLYNNLNDASMRLEQSLREVQLFLQKVRAEGLPIRWF